MRNRTKTTVPRIERAGAWLLEAHRTRAPFAPLPAELAPRDAGEAYAIQSEFAGMRAAALGQVTGYKIALTTAAMRAMVGLDDSIAGCMLDKTILRHRPNAVARVRAADYVRLIVEFELGFELAEDLPAIGAPYDRKRVAAAVAAVMPALELADDRNADYKALPANPLMLIADNAWNEGAVLGAPVRDWQGVDLAALQGVASDQCDDGRNRAWPRRDGSSARCARVDRQQPCRARPGPVARRRRHHRQPGDLEIPEGGRPGALRGGLPGGRRAIRGVTRAAI